jgi:hypothetical protein
VCITEVKDEITDPFPESLIECISRQETYPAAENSNMCTMGYSETETQSEHKFCLNVKGLE